ncbi:hypothetical protein AAMO2058_000062800 [Amorphochlora amoebiformis]
MSSAGYHASTYAVRRIFACLWRQSACNIACPVLPRLEGKTVLVTGGNGGIGLETVRGLYQRGAHVLLGCRTESKGFEAAELITKSREGKGKSAEKNENVGSITVLGGLDLSNIKMVRESVKNIESKNIDVLICNAGIHPSEYGTSAQGHEITFATNVLGHYELIKTLRTAGRLQGSRIVILTGEIYVLSNESSLDFKWSGSSGAHQAYCRSKLGNLWLAMGVENRWKDLQVYSVHPGVVSTGLVHLFGGLGEWLKRQLFLTPTQGAQTSLRVATQDLKPGYYSNTCGRLILDASDSAVDKAKAEKMWKECEAASNAVSQ